MKFNEYISTHRTFTTEKLLETSDSTASATHQLWRAAKTGKVEQVRRGVYVSFAGRFEGHPASPLEVMAACDPHAVACYHAALTALGIAHSASFQTDFMSSTVKSAFTYRGVRYVPHPADEVIVTTRVRAGENTQVLCTSKEQTIVSCLDRPWAAGGTEEVVRSLTLLAYIDEEALLSILEPMAAPSKARVGWLLDCMRETWHISDTLMEKLYKEIGEGPYRLGRPRSGESGWSQQWSLLLPGKSQEVASWISTL